MIIGNELLEKLDTNFDAILNYVKILLNKAEEKQNQEIKDEVKAGNIEKIDIMISKKTK